MIVVDASVIITALADDGPDGTRARTRLLGEQSLAPHIIDLEVISAWRRLIIGGQLSAARAQQAVDDLGRIRIRRVDHRVLLDRCWQLRENVTPYDAAYVALAEFADAVLVTADARLANAPGPRCVFEVVA